VNLILRAGRAGVWHAHRKIKRRRCAYCTRKGNRTSSKPWLGTANKGKVTWCLQGKNQEKTEKRQQTERRKRRSGRGELRGLMAHFPSERQGGSRVDRKKGFHGGESTTTTTLRRAWGKRSELARQESKLNGKKAFSTEES